MLLCSQRNCLFLLPFRSLWLGKIMELNSFQCVAWNSPCGLNFTFFFSLFLLSSRLMWKKRNLLSCLLRLFISYCWVRFLFFISFYVILDFFFILFVCWLCDTISCALLVLRSIRSLWWDLMKDHPLLIACVCLDYLIVEKCCFPIDVADLWENWMIGSWSLEGTKR